MFRALGTWDGLNDEEEKKGYEECEDPERFSHRKAENQATELSVGC